MNRAISITTVMFLTPFLGACQQFCENYSESHYCKSFNETTVKINVSLIKSKMNLPLAMAPGLTISDLRHDEKHAIFVYTVEQTYVKTFADFGAFERDTRRGIISITCNQKDNFNYLYKQGIETIHRFIDESEKVVLEVNIGKTACSSS
jgi:hypothetical protein